jgi:hypothetical protein
MVSDCHTDSHDIGGEAVTRHSVALCAEKISDQDAQSLGLAAVEIQRLVLSVSETQIRD